MSHPNFPDLPHLVEVQVDEEMHQVAPQGPMEQMSWAALDTAWHLLRDTAARVALQNLRESAAEAGISFPSTDEEMFQGARESGIVGMPTGYRDLAPWDDEAMAALATLYQSLVNLAIDESLDGLRDGL